MNGGGNLRDDLFRRYFLTFEARDTRALPPPSAVEIDDLIMVRARVAELVDKKREANG